MEDQATDPVENKEEAPVAAGEAVGNETPVIDEAAVAAAAAEKLKAAEENLAAKEAAWTEAKVTAETLKEQGKTLTVEKREATKNVKTATDYIASLGDRTDENGADYDNAKTSLDGWNGVVEAKTKEIEANKVAKATQVEVVRAARAEINEAKKAVTAAKSGKPRASGGGGGAPRSKFTDEDVLKHGGVEPKGGVMKVVYDAFGADGKTYGEAMKQLITHFEANVPTSGQWTQSKELYVGGYIRGAVNAGYLAKAA